MKRSEINNYVEQFLKFCKKYQYILPEFDLDSPEIIEEIKARQLGWDITDYGSGDFTKTGLSLFTIRNGNPTEKGTVPYCEKTMFSLAGQKTPCHYHVKKTEDIFVRAGSKLIIKIWPSEQGKIDGLEMKVLFNGSEYREIISGQEIKLSPGETVTLTPKEAHEFHADTEGHGALVGEVSTYNDDQGDNYFIDPISRFPAIEEDEEIRYPLVGDYTNISPLHTSNSPSQIYKSDKSTN